MKVQIYGFRYLLSNLWVTYGLTLKRGVVKSLKNYSQIVRKHAELVLGVLTRTDIDVERINFKL